MVVEERLKAEIANRRFTKAVILNETGNNNLSQLNQKEEEENLPRTCTKKVNVVKLMWYDRCKYWTKNHLTKDHKSKRRGKMARINSAKDNDNSEDSNISSDYVPTVPRQKKV